jgi:RNA polymerase sigma-70 factor (ECF subfamily)
LARNVHIDYCRKQQKVSDKFVQVEEYDVNILEESVPYREEEYERLDRALAKLSPDQKEIIILSRFQGLKYEEISSIQNLSVSAIKVQMHRAIKQLRQHYFKLT